MKSLLIWPKLSCVIIRDIIKPMQEKDESNTKFAEQLKDWDNKNHMVL